MPSRFRGRVRCGVQREARVRFWNQRRKRIQRRIILWILREENHSELVERERQRGAK